MIIKYRFINLPIVKRDKESKIGTVGVPTIGNTRVSVAYYSFYDNIQLITHDV